MSPVELQRMPSPETANSPLVRTPGVAHSRSPAAHGLRAAQANFSRTGGLHAAALFDASGILVVLREDIGRHNAVDKVIGWALKAKKIPLTGHILLASGRGGFEIVQKALVAGVPLLASVSAPSSLASVFSCSRSPLS